MIQRKKRNSSKTNLVISAVFHTVLILAIFFFFAAREGMLGKKLKEITVTMVPKEKKLEPPKPKPEEPKAEQPKQAENPRVNVPPPKALAAATAPPPSGDNAPAAAPAPTSLPAFEFEDGAKQVQTISDPNAVYKALIEYQLKSRWNRPDDMDDSRFAAEVEIGVDSTGKLKDAQWTALSGNSRWDTSVKKVVAETRGFNKPPPKGFPAKFRVRFDVESVKSESLMEVGSR